jgi:hypothetical protein
VRDREKQRERERERERGGTRERGRMTEKVGRDWVQLRFLNTCFIFCPPYNIKASRAICVVCFGLVLCFRS